MYVLEELLLADSLEKIIRMEVYLNDVVLQATEDEIKIVEFYKNIIQKIKTQLENSADSLKTYHDGKIPEEIFTTYIKNCLNVSGKIRIFHDEFLLYLPTLKTRTETYTFLKNLLQEIIEIKTEPAIVLTDIYNYEERNISQSLKEKGIIEGEIQEQIIIGLPKTEKDNPLMWTILVHEIGHALAENKDYLNISNRIVKEGITDKRIDYSHQTILINWIKEIISDLLSIRVMGPSYVYSFIFYNLLISDLDAFSSTHPSPKDRILIMMSTLEKKGFELTCIKDLYDLICQRQKQTKNFISVIDTCPECGIKIDPIPDIEKIKEEFCQLVDFSVKILNEIEVREFTPDNIVNGKKLAENLNNFIPISSSKKMNDTDLKKLYSSFNKETNDVYSLLEKFEEKPNSVSEIINAGWLHKINNSYSEFIKYFFDNNDENNNTFDKKYENYKNYLIKNDVLLLKSLEIADMHLLFESGRSLLSS